MLDGEEATFTAVHGANPELFTIASSARRLIVGTLDGPQVRFQTPAGITERVAQASLGLLVKSMRMHRAIEAVVERGLEAEAHVAMRNLFEVVVALRFVTKSRAILRKGRKRVAVPGKPLTTDFRALMYQAHIAFDVERAFDSMPRRRGRSSREELEAKRRAAADAQRFRAAVGDWAQLMTAGRYSGVSLRDLCLSLGLEKTYRSVYKPLSWATHAADGTNFAQWNGDGLTLAVQASTHGVVPAMVSSTAMLLLAVEFADGRLGLGIGNEASKLLKGLRALDR